MDKEFGGTKFTMQNDFYQQIFKPHNIDIFVPNKSQIDFIHLKVVDEMAVGIFKEETKNEFLEIVSGLKEKHDVEAVILGCTEFPILLREKEYLGLPFLNTTKIHVEAILKECLKED